MSWSWWLLIRLVVLFCIKWLKTDLFKFPVRRPCSDTVLSQLKVLGSG